MTNANDAESTTSDFQVRQTSESEDISIVMAVYNHEATLVEALESALMQKMPYTSVIYCFDDASTDKSAEILSEYAKRYPGKIRVYTNPENLGSGKKSFHYHRPPVKGRFWCFLAGDDYWTSPHKVAKQVAFLESNPEYSGCSCKTVMKNEITGEESIIEPSCNSWNLMDLMLNRYALYVHTSSVTWRNIYLEKGFFLPPQFRKKYASGDVVLMHMMLAKGGKIKNIPEVMSCYRYTGKGIWSMKTDKEREDFNNRVLPKMISRSIPLKYKFYISLQKRWPRSKIIKRFVPRYINE